MRTPDSHRDANLDLLRASAILMVLAYHVVQRWPVPLPELNAVTRFGEYGVDLFFVLSGWLIGTLLWRELDQFGDVEVGRFIVRRALRTMPPYFVALMISFVGVKIMRHEPFNWGFLAFLQNYYNRIPFFLVSWSLCVEEHFYLVMPFIALLIARGKRWGQVFFFLLLLVPIICRLSYRSVFDGQPFGYFFTATHLRYEGLLLGVWASYLRVRAPEQWNVLRRFASFAVIPLLIVALGTSFLPVEWRYSFFYSATAAFYVVLLVSIVERKPLLRADSKAVFWIATTSYSVYLTHAFTLDLVLRLLRKLPANGLLQAAVFIVCIGFVGIVFYRLVEVPSLTLRSRLMPRRSKERSPLLDGVAAANLEPGS